MLFLVYRSLLISLFWTRNQNSWNELIIFLKCRFLSCHSKTCEFSFICWSALERPISINSVIRNSSRMQSTFNRFNNFYCPNEIYVSQVSANYTLLAFIMCCVYGWSEKIKWKESASKSAVESPFGEVIFHQFNKRKEKKKVDRKYKLLANVHWK